MKKILISLLVIFTITNCFTIGKVGYIVPAPDDSQKRTGEVVAERCETIITSILDDGNKVVQKRGLSELSNIGIEFTASGCIQFKPLQ